MWYFVLWYLLGLLGCIIGEYGEYKRGVVEELTLGKILQVLLCSVFGVVVLGCTLYEYHFKNSNPQVYNKKENKMKKLFKKIMNNLIFEKAFSNLDVLIMGILLVFSGIDGITGIIFLWLYLLWVLTGIKINSFMQNWYNKYLK